MVINEIKNGNLNKVYLIEDNNDKFILRISNFDTTFENKVLDLLNDNEFSAPEKIINFRYNDKNIMLCRYIEGDNLTSITVNIIEQIGFLLKKLHQIEYDFDYNEYADNLESFDKLLFYYDQIVNSKYIINDKELIENKIISLKDFSFDYLPKSLLHSDLKKENIIVIDDKVNFIDFGNAYVGPRVIDLIRVAMWFFIKEKRYDIELLRKLLISYDGISLLEKQTIDKLFDYCLLYNYIKDVYLYENNYLPDSYILENDIFWLDALKGNDELEGIKNIFKSI